MYGLWQLGVWRSKTTNTQVQGRLALPPKPSEQRPAAQGVPYMPSQRVVFCYIRVRDGTKKLVPSRIRM